MLDVPHELIAAATRLAERCGRGPPASLTQLAGGKNNRVFRCVFDDAPPLVLKSYFSDPRDPRDRLAAEWSFLSYAWGRGVRAIPEPVAAEASSRTALMGFVRGRKLSAEAIGIAEIDAAADFVLAVNAAPRDSEALAPGSEACFSFAQHLATVDRRVERLFVLDPQAPCRVEAERLIAAQLVPEWRRLRASITAAAGHGGIDGDEMISASACCLSPSDFGFHNALRDEGGLVFLDFEYAGRDDPAKLVCDFFCQPEVPVPTIHFERFLARIGDGLGLSARDRLRCRLLLDAYRIKWTCIILNDFLPLGAARRSFAHQDTWTTRCAAQLRKADAKLSEIAAS
jgi:hypothetical protein